MINKDIISFFGLKKRFLPNTLGLLAGLLFSDMVLAGELQVNFTDTDGNLLEDGVIELVEHGIQVPVDWDYSGLMDQIDKEFVDNVITVVAGSYVDFPNQDNIHHHVYSFSDNKTFELPLYIGNSAEPIMFEQAGVTIVGCNIHDWMLGYIYVAESHLVARSSTDGAANIRNLPAGEYTFKAWHPRIRRRDQNEIHTVTVSNSGVTEYTIELNLGRDPRIRRAPTGSDKGY